MLVLHLFNEVNPVTGEDHISDDMLTIGRFNSIQWTYGHIRLQRDGLDFDLLRHNDEAIKYDGRYWGDFRIASDEEVEFCVDVDVNTYTKHKYIASVDNAVRRLLLVEDDIISIRKIIDASGVELKGTDGVEVGTYLTNVEVACDLTSDESDTWGFINLDNKELVKKLKAVGLYKKPKTARELAIEEIVAKLKALDNGDGVDGETMEQILDEVGMKEQVLSQIVRCVEHREEFEGYVKDLLDETDDIRNKIYIKNHEVFKKSLAKTKK